MEFTELARGGNVWRPVAGGVDIQMLINNFSDYISFTECDLEVFCNFFRVVVVLQVHRKEIKLPRKYAGKTLWESPDFISEHKPRIKVQINIPRKVYHGSGEQQSTSNTSYLFLYFGCYILLLGCVFCAAPVMLAPARDNHFVPGFQIDAPVAADPTSGHRKYCQFCSYGAVASALGGLVIFFIYFFYQKYSKH